MSEFNPMTIVAAAEVISGFNSHGDMAIFEVQWGIADLCNTANKSARIASWAKIAIQGNINVMTENGLVTMGRALVESAIKAPAHLHHSEYWKKLVAGLRFDGFEIREEANDHSQQSNWPYNLGTKAVTLVRMLPEAVPGLDFREAESEVAALLDRHGFAVARGHLNQALSAFQRGEWAAANGQLRNFYEGYLSEIACRLGYVGAGDGRAKRDFLGGNLEPPFLLSEYNEWHANNQRPQYVQGLMSRMHPHGGHPGLSEEEDATFRLQITLITARLFLRRFDARRRP